MHNKPVQDIFDLVCDWLPGPTKLTCLYLVAEYGAAVTKFIESGLNPDEVCHAMKICTNAECQMYPTNGAGSTSEQRHSTWKRSSSSSSSEPLSKSKTPELLRALSQQVGANPWQWLEDLFLAVADHEPDFDFDGDHFGAEPTLRGYNWRGKDCDNFDSTVYPGRATGTPGNDYDCNGVSGFNPTTMKPYKDELCDGVEHYGVVAVGDSAGAHFAIPPSYMNASEIGPNTYRSIDRLCFLFVFVFVYITVDF